MLVPPATQQLTFSASLSHGRRNTCKRNLPANALALPDRIIVVTDQMILGILAKRDDLGGSGPCAAGRPPGC
ncbi:hypothetical protein [Massilia horti]|uniref:hypothetical protein n=1 Tax=Massilia horti TaxID=2562153 RepID=UPI00142F7B97|nr:hypothetical protein [Massilia horti]